jgi:hypothetical protein
MGQPDRNPIGAAVQLPVDLRGIVALLVGTVLHEFGRGADPAGAMGALERPTDHPPRGPVHPRIESSRAPLVNCRIG